LVVGESRTGLWQRAPRARERVSLIAELTVRGHALRLRGTDLYLDSPSRVPLGFVSHAGVNSRPGAATSGEPAHQRRGDFLATKRDGAR